LNEEENKGNDRANVVFSVCDNRLEHWFRNRLLLRQGLPEGLLLGSRCRADRDRDLLSSAKAVDFVRPKAANNSGQWVELPGSF
jgi:hypothetical protein